MVESIKWIKDKVFAAFAKEPVVMLNALFAAGVAIQQAVNDQVTAGDGWGVVAWVVLVAAVRQFVSPAVKQ